MDPSSPAKRRALAPLDANVNAMSPAPKMHNKLTKPASPLRSPIKSPLGLKRPLGAVIFDENSVVAKKKQCKEPANPPVSASEPVQALAAAAVTAVSTPAPASSQTEEEPDANEAQDEQQAQEEEQQPKMQDEEQQQQTPRNRSASPDTSSVFDNSAMDTSQNTTIITEPDTEQVRTLPPPRPRRLLTREEARQKARILRLKLGLANYKLQTGQENVPLEMLQMKPLPDHDTRRSMLPMVMIQPPSSRDGPPSRERVETREAIRQTDGETSDQEEEQQPAEKTLLSNVSETDRTEDGDNTTNAVCGGVANSLLSLARGSSSVSTSS
ncbi:uncharacterized protein CTRU02_213001 [Colletotrichum truncatum]|uniref:Uncharacterized protein n=1 Tax=Colletotrichum truncatum TaxID=5467 RepID=A0ACC3YJG1_COLTU|nr:uncharacterized protein CTRU02_03320 [Colletotrichum truncatum]KAF6797289.1 hypothetical protein CTRU02_03320 [Colletotrichum truncatum]